MGPMILVPICIAMFLTGLNRCYTNCKTDKLQKEMDHRCGPKVEQPKDVKPPKLPCGCNGPK